MRLLPALLGFALAAIAAVPAFADDVKIGDIVVSGAWSRATPNGAKIGVGYIRLTNTGTESDRLVSLSSDVAAKTEIHEMTMKDGIMTMRPLPQGIDLDPGETVELKPGGTHIMFIDLTRPLKEGQQMSAKLVFEHGGAGMVDFDIESIGAQSSLQK